MKRYLPLLALLLLIAPIRAHAAITFDAANSAGAGVSDTSISMSSGNTASLPNSIGILVSNTNSNTSGCMTSVVWGGKSMTQFLCSGTFSIHYVFSPPTGVQTVSGNWASPTEAVFWALTYGGVSQSAPLSLNAESGGNSNDITKTVTTTIDKSWAIMLGYQSTAATLSAGSGSTVRASQVTAGAFRAHLVDSNAEVTPAGAKTLHISSTASAAWSALIFALAPAVSSFTPWQMAAF
jgi:hypothetical protein